MLDICVLLRHALLHTKPPRHVLSYTELPIVFIFIITATMRIVYDRLQARKFEEIIQNCGEEF